MRRLRLGDAGALEELMRRHWPDLVRYAARLTGAPDLAEDLAQDTFVALWRQRAAWQPTGSPRAFLYGIARNLALKEHRRGSVRRRLADWVRGETRRPATPLETTQQAELRGAFERALAQLTPRRREAFVLVRYHHLSLGEVADIMGISRQTVANQVSSAVSDLRVLLRDFS